MKQYANVRWIIESREKRVSKHQKKLYYTKIETNAEKNEHGTKQKEWQNTSFPVCSSWIHSVKPQIFYIYLAHADEMSKLQKSLWQKMHFDL